MRKIIESLMDREVATTPELAEAADVSTRHASRLLNRLAREGNVEKEPSPKPGNPTKWYVPHGD